MARNVKSIVAVKACGCVSASHAYGDRLMSSDAEHTFRHLAEIRGCAVHIVPAGQSENQLLRCRFGEDRSRGCAMPAPPPDWSKRAPAAEPTWAKDRTDAYQ